MSAEASGSSMTKQLVIGIVVFGVGIGAVWYGLDAYFRRVEMKQADKVAALAAEARERMGSGEAPAPAKLPPPANEDEAVQRMNVIAQRIGIEFRERERLLDFARARMETLGWIDPVSLRTERLLEERIRFAGVLADEAEKSRAWLAGVDEHIRRLTDQQGLKPEQAQQLIDRFREDMQVSSRLRLAELHKTIGTETKAILESARTHWGKWRPAPGGTYEFEDPATNALVASKYETLDSTFRDLGATLTEILRVDKERVDAEGRALEEELRRRFGDRRQRQHHTDSPDGS